MYSIICKIKNLDIASTNEYLESLCGIVNFFSSDEEKVEFLSLWESNQSIVAEDRVSYGDWQTPIELAESICKQHLELYGEPDVVIEPTCGKGSFIISALRVFSNISEIYAVEINPRYTLELKYQILSESLMMRKKYLAKIHIFTADFFSFNFSEIFEIVKKPNYKLAIIGNPPWVTNSVQGIKESSNIPPKVNKYNLKGIDAITGKSNFDISEYIISALLSYACGCTGGMSILLKNSVVRNIVMKQKQNKNLINSIRQYNIDARKEFNVSVDASCLTAKLGRFAEDFCEIYDFYSHSKISSFGWTANSFVSNFNDYTNFKSFDGTCPFIWRSGVKHDCSEILELEEKDGMLYNKLGEVVDIERELVYPLLKSADVAKSNYENVRKYILITQRYVGENTAYIQSYLPKTYSYLTAHKEYFEKRKSSIYKGKGLFSIFGIGEYSFMPYKIAISSLYKSIKFSIIKPYKSKPILLDDTCYQIGFTSLAEAENALKAFQSEEIMSLIKSISFSDSKRVITKALLMRLDVSSLINTKQVSYTQLSLFD